MEYFAMICGLKDYCTQYVFVAENETEAKKELEKLYPNKSYRLYGYITSIAYGKSLSKTPRTAGVEFDEAFEGNRT